SGYVWGRYMIIYSKGGVKGKPVAARIYLREKGIVLRLFLNRIDEHRAYLEQAPLFILEPFINEHGRCHHCKNDKAGQCKFRKTYTLHNNLIEKCNGFTFEFPQPDLHKLPDYLGLLAEFYPVKRKGRA
ncbi:MAG: hypothetical protein PHE50_09155, partial [Dehalococcoidales bacterium]|nr:hypothetical protein [Dehalococcoidales bacterium]